MVGGRYEQQSERVRVAYDFLNRVFGRPVFHQPQDCGEVTARGAKWWSTAFPHWFFAAVEAQFHQDLQESLTAEELVRRMTQGKCQVQQASSENPATLCGGRNRIGEPMRYFPKFPASPHTMSQTIRCRQHGQEKCPECQATADAEWMPGAGMLERVDPDPAEGPAGRFVQCPARIREAMMTGLDKGFATREQLGLTEEQQVQLLGNVCSVVSVKVMLLTAAAYSIHRKMLEEQRGQQGENLDSAYVQPEQQSVEEVKHMLQPAIDASAEQASAAVLSPLETLRRVDQRRVAARQQRNRQRNLYQKPALLTEAKRRKIAKVEKARREKERQAQRALQKHAMRQAEANADAIREERRDRKLRDRRQVQLVNTVLTLLAMSAVLPQMHAVGSLVGLHLLGKAQRGADPEPTMHPDETMSPAEQRCGQRQHEEWRQNLRSWWSRVSVKRRLRPAKRKARAKLRTKHRDHPAGGVSMAGQGHAAQLSTTTAADPGSASAATPSAPRTEEEEVDEMVQHMVQNDPEAMAAQWEELLDRRRAIGTPDVMLEGDSKLFDSRTQQPHKWKIGQYFPLVNELCQLLDEQPPALYVFRLEDLKQIGGQPDQVGYRITFKSGTKPEYVHQYKLAEQEKEYVSKWLKELVDAGIVSESNSPWGAPLVLAPKKDAEGKWSKVRVAVDLRRLNRWIEWDGFPPSDPEETLRRASGWKWMSVCDCSSAFYQIPVGDEETRQALSFTAALPGEGARQWSFNRMCFGSKDAPACWNRLIRRALGDLEEWSGSRMPKNMDQHPVLSKLSISTDTNKIRGRVLCYADDLCIMANTPEDHLVLLQLVFQRLTDFGIQLAPPKMNMGVQRANFLGHVCGESGVEPMHDKMQGIEDMKEPRTVSEVRSFLGCVGYYVDHLSGSVEGASATPARLPASLPFRAAAAVSSCPFAQGVVARR